MSRRNRSTPHLHMSQCPANVHNDFGSLCYWNVSTYAIVSSMFVALALDIWMTQRKIVFQFNVMFLSMFVGSMWCEATVWWVFVCVCVLSCVGSERMITDILEFICVSAMRSNKDWSYVQHIHVYFGRITPLGEFPEQWWHTPTPYTRSRQIHIVRAAWLIPNSTLQTTEQRRRRKSNKSTHQSAVRFTTDARHVFNALR